MSDLILGVEVALNYIVQRRIVRLYVLKDIERNWNPSWIYKSG